MLESLEPLESSQPEKAQLPEKEAKFVELVARVEAVVKKLREFAELRKLLLAALWLNKLHSLEKVVEQVPSLDEGGFAEDLNAMSEEVQSAHETRTDESRHSQIATALREGSIRLRTFTEFVVHDGKLQELETFLTEAMEKGMDMSSLLDVLEKANNKVILAEEKHERMQELLDNDKTNKDALQGLREARESRFSTIQHYRALALGYASRLSEGLKTEVEKAFTEWLDDPLKVSNLYALLDKVRAQTTDNFNTLRVRKEILAFTRGLPQPGEIANLLDDLANLAAAESTEPSEPTSSEANE